MFAFCRYINVSDSKALIDLLSDVWIRKLRLHANVARFDRNVVSKSSHVGNKDSIDLQPKKPYLTGEKTNNVVNMGTNNSSFTSVLNAGGKPKIVADSARTIVLDDECIMERDLSCALMGKIKDINALSNLYVILTNKEKFLKHVGVASWFIELLPATNSFVSKVRLVWIFVEGLPIKSWTSNTFVKIVSPWGVLSDVDIADDSSLPFKRLCVVAKPHIIINDIIKVIIKGQAYWIHVKELEAWSPDFNNEFCEDSSSNDESVNKEVDHVSDTYDKGADFDKEKKANFVLDSTGTNDKGADDLDKEKNDDYVKSSFDMNVNGAVLNNHGPSSKLKPNSKDPFGIYELLNRNKNKQDSKSEDSIFPLGFTPNAIEDTDVENLEHSINQPNASLSSNMEGTSRAKSGSNGSLQLKLDVMEGLVEVGFKMNFLSLNVQGLGQPAKKSWIRELNGKYKVNFVAIQETKLEDIDLFSIRDLWDNFSYDFAFSPSNGYSGGLLCVWDPTMFSKDSVTISDSVLAIRGTWTSSSTKLLIVFVYAPQDLSERKNLWEYISHMINLWDEECAVLEDFNEVRSEHERFDTMFNASGANAFNHFISSAGLVDLPLKGYSYTWALKSTSKMSKLDRFLISLGLLSVFPSLSAICLDRHLSDHRPILMRDLVVDYGPTLFCVFHSWFTKDGFDKPVEDSWKTSTFVDSNNISLLKKKFKALKESIKYWCKADKQRLQCVSIFHSVSNF
ncbi:RNA-directed DNA polymerase, eukaryota [Tanacetum coccineum]